MRHTFGTHLSKGGVAPRTAQAAMRHGSIDLTMNTYTDPELLDVREALEALPRLPLCEGQKAEKLRATGTDGTGPLAPMLAPTPDASCISEASAVTMAGARGLYAEVARMAQDSARGVFAGTEGYERVERAMGFEPTTSSLGS